MQESLLSPCGRCGRVLPGLQCAPHQRSRCKIFLEYIQKLNRLKASKILLGELKNLITK